MQCRAVVGGNGRAAARGGLAGRAGPCAGAGGAGVLASGVGSTWLHETARRLAEAFDAAAAEAPAVVLLDALGRTRADGQGPTSEEDNTLLRLVEAAPGRRLLVVGTTNRPDATDPALWRATPSVFVPLRVTKIVRSRTSVAWTVQAKDGKAAQWTVPHRSRPFALGPDGMVLGLRCQMGRSCRWTPPCAGWS